MFWHTVILLLANSFLTNSFVDNNAAFAFFKNHSIKNGIILTCGSKKEQVKVAKYIIPNKYIMSTGPNIHRADLLHLLYIKHGRIGVVMDGDCKDAKKVISWCGRHRFFDLKYYWLILTNNSFEYMFSGANINVDSNIQIMSKNVFSPNQYDIYEFHNPAAKKGGSSVITKIGQFSNQTGYAVNDVNIINNKFWHRRNLTGVLFNTTLVFHEPYSGTYEEYLQNTEHRDKNTYNRFHAKLMGFCREHYNFSLNVNVTNLFGYQKGDGTMDGLVGDLERNLADFGLSPLFVRRDRAEVITYGRLSYTIRSAFVFLNPKSKAMFEIFLRPLSPTVWYCLLGFCVLASFIIKAISSIKTSSNSDSTWAYSILCVIGIFSQQGMIDNPTKISGKIGILFLLNLSYFVYMFYSGSLVSSLLNVPLDLIETIDDILSANFKIGIEDIRLNREYFKFTVDNSSLKLYYSAIAGKEHEVYQSAISGLKRIKGGRFAFHVELAKAYHFIEDQFREDNCNIREISMYKPIQCHANYAKHSAFRDIMDVCLHRIAESGVLEKERAFWHMEKPDCQYTFKINTGIEEIYPVLISMTVGLIISTTILFLEIILTKLRKA